MRISQATISLIKRVVAFLLLFIVISGLLGSRIISEGIILRDGFAVYGGLGKALLFSAIAFLFLARNKKNTTLLMPLKANQATWLGASALFVAIVWDNITILAAANENVYNVLLVHFGLVASVATALLGCFGGKNLQKLWGVYKREFLQAGIIAALFYGFLHVVYLLWQPLAAVVLAGVHALSKLVNMPAETMPPNILLTDKFGITIAEYCSGIESIALFTGLYIIVGLVEKQRLHIKRYLLLFPIALIVLFLLNIIRVFALIAAGYYYNPEIAFSLFHSYAGMVFFILYSVAFWAIAYKYILRRKQHNTKQNTPKNIIISHVYSSDNKGDAALTSVLISDLRRKFPAAVITILRLESIQKNGMFEGVPEQPSFMYFALNRHKNSVLKLLYTIYMMGATLLWAAWYRLFNKQLYLPPHLRQTAELYKQADLIVPVGGGYIRSRKGLLNRMNIPLLLHPLLIGMLLQKPTVLYAQSVGPFQNKFEKFLVAFVLKRMTLILLREDKSVALLALLGVTKNVKRAVDSGFLLSGAKKINIRKEYKISKKRLIIGVTVRSWLTGDAQKQYETDVAKALDKLIETKSAHVIFIPQVTATKGDDDRIVSRRVQKSMQHKKHITVVNEVPNHHEIKSIYDNLDLLLGTRFHSVIFSLTSFVPVVAIEYEHKTSGIMHDLRLDKWVIKIEDVTEQRLTRLLEKLVAERTEYRQILKERVPKYQIRALESADLTEKAYEDFNQSQNN